MFLDQESERNFSAVVEALKTGNATAFIGAGLSASYQPTWEELHHQLQVAANAAPARNFRSEDAPADFEYFRDLLGSARFLELLKIRFAGPVADYPELYRVIDETEGFRHIVTTNFDEFLATVAQKNNRNPEIATYPTFRPATGRYIYLHGRSSTASEASDLIICESDYAEAYGNQFGPRPVIQGLLTGNVVFIGYSLNDGDIQATLRGLKTFRGTLPKAITGDLFIFRPVEPQHFERDIAIVGDRLRRRWDLRPIWYLREPGHPQLEVLLRQMQHEAGARDRGHLFIEYALSFQELGVVTSPSQAQIEQVVNVLRVPENAWSFFRVATSPGWYEPLLNAGILETVAEPRLLPTGEIQTVTWAAAAYVDRIATERPDAIVELTRRLAGSKNRSVLNALSRTASRLPSDHLLQALSVFTDWMDRSIHGRDIVGSNLVETIETLCERRLFAPAIDILEQLIQFRSRDVSGNEDIELRIDHNELERLLTILPLLVSENPSRLYIIFKRQLQQIRAQAPRGHRSSLWRPTIAEHDWELFPEEKAVNFLVTGMRDGLISWLSLDVASGAAELSALIQSNDELLYRIGLNALTARPEIISKVSAPLFVEESFSNHSYEYELLMLLHQRFGELPASARELVHQVIERGPLIDSELEMSADDQQQVLDRWRWHLIGTVPKQFRTPQETAWWDGLYEEYGDIESYLVPRQRPTARARFDDLSADEAVAEEIYDAYQTGITSLLDKLRNTGHWGRVQALIREDPIGLLSLTEHFETEDFNHLGAYFTAYQDIARQASDPFPWAPIISLMSRITEYSDANREVLLRMMWLLSDGLVGDPPTVPDDLIVDSLKVSAAILGGRSTPLGSLQTMENGIHSHQLNSPAGQAAESFMHCIWMIADEGKIEHPGIPDAAYPYVYDALMSGWGGLEIRYALGQCVRLLEWCQPGWIAQHADKLMPGGDTDCSITTGYSFLHGYLHSSPYTSSIMRVVVPLWNQAVSDLGAEEPYYLSERQSSEQFAEHILLGYVFDIEGYGPGGLLGQLVTFAPDKILGEVIRWATNQLQHYDEQTRQLWLEKLDAYWIRRAKDLSTLPTTESSDELSAFILWAKGMEIPIAKIEDRLNTSIDHLHQQYGRYGLFEYLTERAPMEPDAVTRLLLRLVERSTRRYQGYLFPGYKLDTLIDAICQSDGTYQADLIAVIDRLVEAGNTNLVDKLDQWRLRDKL